MSVYGTGRYGTAVYGDVSTPDEPSDRPMRIHGLFSSYFGEDEFDVGKSVHWNEQFFDTAYAMDSMAGHHTRTFVIDWSKSFPEINAGYYQGELNFFEGGAAEWRRTLFEQGDKAQGGYDDDDWVVFVDCTEGMSCDDRVDRFPTDPVDTLYSIYRPWLEAEILVTSSDTIYLPVYAFIGNSAVWLRYPAIDPTLQATIDTMTDTDIYQSMTKAQLNKINHAVVEDSYQSWTLAGWSPRMYKVSVLRDLDFDWTLPDTFYDTLDPASYTQTGLAITSYAYARWTKDRERINYATQRPLTEADDDGWRIRQLISRVRPVAGLPFDDWSSADDDGRTFPHAPPPASAHPVDNAFSRDFDDGFANFDAIVPTVPGDSWAEYSYLQSLYPDIIRWNPWESLYFTTPEHQPPPWNFYTGQLALSPAEQLIVDSRAAAMSQMPPKPMTVMSSRSFSPAEQKQKDEAETPSVVPPASVTEALAAAGITNAPDTVVAVTIPEGDPVPEWNEGNWNEGTW